MALAAVVALVITTSLFVAVTPHAIAAAPGARSASAPAARSSDVTAAALPPTHGDLTVGSGATYTIQPTSGGFSYYQGGNITVDSGGTLYVRNVTLSFVSFVGVTGAPEARLSHIYHFSDFGTAVFDNVTVTTDVGILNPYAKLNLTVRGTLTATDTKFEFPGWFYVNGTHADATLNDSEIAANPAVPSLGGLEAGSLYGDTLWGPTVYTLSGAQLNLFHSGIVDMYENNLLSSGYTRPAPLLGPAFDLTAGDTTLNLTGPNSAQALMQDWLYPNGSVESGYVAVPFYDTNAPGNATQSNNTVANIGVEYDGTNYVLGTYVFYNGTNGIATVSFTPQLEAAISASTMLGYINATGSFGSPEAIFATYTTVTGPVVAMLNTTVQVNTTGPDYDMHVAGTGSTLTAVDSTLSVNWTGVGGNIYSAYPPWLSNKLTFQNGSAGYLANVTVASSIPGPFSTSAFLADNTSAVYLYRWAQINVTSGSTGLSGAQLSVFYAYNSQQSNNQTASALNDIATADPSMWGYVQYLDGVRGAPGYGQSNALGEAQILVASNNLTGGTLPDGNFLGDYHVAISVPGFTAPTHWFNWSVPPYPTGVAPGTTGFGMPVYGPTQVFPGYKFEIAVISATPPSSTTLSLSQIYTTSGLVRYNGTEAAAVDVYATPTSGGVPILIGTGSATSNVQFTVTWNPLKNVLSAGQSYSLSVTATAYGVTSAPYVIAGTYTVPGPVTPWYDEKVLGLPLWIWIVIAAAIVAGVLGFLLFARRQAAGRLVECGECGNLIPEDATVCPKCGAEFEHDLIRCSRCASTIPADSKVCPECAAQLLGKPGEQGTDPEAQGYGDFTERYRAEAKRELGDNYSEGAFWDWWKRQPTYVSFSQWKLQQGTGTSRAGMTAPPAAEGEAPAGGPKTPPGGAAGQARRPPPRRSAGPSAGAARSCRCGRSPGPAGSSTG